MNYVRSYFSYSICDLHLNVHCERGNHSMVIKSVSLIIQDFLIAFNNLLLIHNELWVSYCIATVGRKLYRGALLKTFFEPANILRLHMTFSKNVGGRGAHASQPPTALHMYRHWVSLNKMI